MSNDEWEKQGLATRFPRCLHLFFLAAAAEPELSEESGPCYACHSKTSAALVKEWEHSLRSQSGIGCYECHRAEVGEADAWTHQGKVISTLVTPKDCSMCHSRAYKEFSASHHACGSVEVIEKQLV